MYSVINNVEKLVSSVSDIAETKIALMKLKAAGKVSTSLSTLIFFYSDSYIWQCGTNNYKFCICLFYWQ